MMERRDGRRGKAEPHPSARTHGITSLVEQTARQVTDLCWSEGLQPTQWSALRYLAAAGAQARSIVGLANFQGINPATASRTISLLERRGLIIITMDPKDKRSRIVTLTEAGHDLLSRDPLKAIERAVAVLPPNVQTGLAVGLRELLAQLFVVERASSDAAPVSEDVVDGA